jgi:D-amino-acid dehydrogenase
MAKRVLVIGAGVIGLSTAYYAARKGHQVTVIDRNPERRGGCSFGNAGMLVPSHFTPLAAPGMIALGLRWMWNPESPFYIQPRLSPELLSWGIKFWRAATPAHVQRAALLIRDLSLASRKCFEELAQLPGNDFGLVKKGLLMLCKSQHSLDDETKTAEQARNLGIPAEVLTAAQTAALDPNVTMDIAGSVYFPLDCHFSPDRFMTALQITAANSGVQFTWETEVKGWQTTAGTVSSIETDRGKLSADEYVLCGGSWSPGIARGLELNIPIQAGKGYSLTLAKPPELPTICSIFTEARVAVTPIGSALRIGGTMEIAGHNEEINPVRVQGIIKAVPNYYPKFKPEHFAGIQPWCGLRPCSPDGLPYLGRTRRYTNLLLATGHAMMGMSLGPITGILVSQLLSDETPVVTIDQLSPDRYA